MDALADGEWCAFPLTFELPDSTGFASITEGRLVDYGGLGLQATGHRTLSARLRTFSRSAIRSSCGLAKKMPIAWQSRPQSPAKSRRRGES